MPVRLLVSVAVVGLTAGLSTLGGGLGVVPARWFVPGKLGAEPKQVTRLHLPAGREGAGFTTRAFSGLRGPEGQHWGERNGLTPALSFSHNLGNVVPPELFAQRPEFFPLVGGQRMNPGPGTLFWNPDIARPDLAVYAAEKAREYFARHPQEPAFALGVNDALLWGESPELLRLATPVRWFRNAPDYSDVVFTFMNRAAAELERTHPDRYLGALAYYWCENVPSFPVHPRVIPFLTADRAQGYDRGFWQEEMALQRRWAAGGGRRETSDGARERGDGAPAVGVKGAPGAERRVAATGAHGAVADTNKEDGKDGKTGAKKKRGKQEKEDEARERGDGAPAVGVKGAPGAERRVAATGAHGAVADTNTRDTGDWETEERGNKEDGKDGKTGAKKKRGKQEKEDEARERGDGAPAVGVKGAPGAERRVAATGAHGAVADTNEGDGKDGKTGAKKKRGKQEKEDEARERGDGASAVGVKGAPGAERRVAVTGAHGAVADTNKGDGKDGKTGGRRLGIYDYVYGVGFLIPRQHPLLLAEHLRHARRVGFTDYFAEVGPNWGLDGPMPWLVAQLLQDPEQSAEGLLDEYYRRYFQGAGEPMRRFFERCAQLWAQQPGPPYWLKHFRNESQAVVFPSSVLPELRGLLDAAAQQAGSARVRARVQLVSDTFGVTERFVRFKETRDELLRVALRVPAGAAAAAEQRRAVAAQLEAYRARRADFIGYTRALQQSEPLALYPFGWDDYLNNDPVPLAEAVLAPERLATVAQERLVDPAMAGTPQPTWMIAGLPYSVALPSPWRARVEPAQHHRAQLLGEGGGGKEETWETGERRNEGAPGAERVLRIEGSRDTQVSQWAAVTALGPAVGEFAVRGRVSPGTAVRLVFAFLDRNNRHIGFRSVRLPDGEWPEAVRLRQLADLPAGTAWVGLGVRVQNQVAGDWVEVRGFSLRF